MDNNPSRLLRRHQPQEQALQAAPHLALPVPPAVPRSVLHGSPLQYKYFLPTMTSIPPQSNQQATTPPQTASERFRIMQRQPRRISITISFQVYQTLLNRSEEEGRSMSNLCAFLLEEVLHHQAPAPMQTPASTLVQSPVLQPSAMQRSHPRFTPYTPEAAPTHNGSFL